MTDTSVVYLDTNVFRDLVEGESEISAPVQSLFETLRKRPDLGITSELTLAEILAPASSGRSRQPHLKRAYMDLLVRGGYLTLQPVSRTVLLETVKLRATRATGKLKLPDAIHLTTAVLSGCRMFVSRDRGIPMPEGMQRVEADVSSVARMIEALH